MDMNQKKQGVATCLKFELFVSMFPCPVRTQADFRMNCGWF